MGGSLCDQSTRRFLRKSPNLIPQLSLVRSIVIIRDHFKQVLIDVQTGDPIMQQQATASRRQHACRLYGEWAVTESVRDSCELNLPPDPLGLTEFGRASLSFIMVAQVTWILTI